MHPTREHAATCVCDKGYFGDPLSLCQKPECTLNKNCPANRVCRNQNCVDPCPGLCGTNAVCSISKHLPTCDCPQGYTGNPSVSCKLSKIFFTFLCQLSNFWKIIMMKLFYDEFWCTFLNTVESQTVDLLQK